MIRDKTENKIIFNKKQEDVIYIINISAIWSIIYIRLLIQLLLIHHLYKFTYSAIHHFYTFTYSTIIDTSFIYVYLFNSNENLVLNDRISIFSIILKEQSLFMIFIFKIKKIQVCFFEQKQLYCYFINFNPKIINHSNKFSNKLNYTYKILFYNRIDNKQKRNIFI